MQKENSLQNTNNKTQIKNSQYPITITTTTNRYI